MQWLVTMPLVPVISEPTAEQRNQKNHPPPRIEDPVGESHPNLAENVPVGAMIPVDREPGVVD